MRRTVVRALLTAAVSIGLLFGLIGPAWAVAIYTYTGNNFTTFAQFPGVVNQYTTSDSVTATMTLNQPLGPNLNQASVVNDLASCTPPGSPFIGCISMSDGLQTLTPSFNNATPPAPINVIGSLSFSTDATGTIVGWHVELVNTNQQTLIRTNTFTTNGAIVEDLGQGPATLFTASVVGSPGVWTLVPEPGTVALLGMGFVAMAGLTRRHT